MQRLRALFHLSGTALSLLLSVCFGVLATLLLGLLFWVRSEASLEQGLHLLAAALPAGQTLQASEVRGSLASGGRVGQLRWSRGELAVQLQDLELAWDWRGLFDGELRVTQLHAQRLQVQDRSAATDGAFSELPLPLHADVHFAVDRLDWAGPPALQAQALRGHYRFDGSTHWLQDASLRIADGSYQLNGQLQASQPMALSVHASGSVQTAVKLRQLPLTLLAKAAAQGTLMGTQAEVELAMDLQPQDSAGQRPLGAMQASLQATLRPAQAQPIASAQAQWTALNLASLWPQAPQTSLSGQAKVLPQDAGWSGQIQLQNNAPGTLDQQRLPLQSASATLRYRDQQWMLSALQATVAGGRLQAQGRYAGSPALWSLAASVQGLQPLQLDSRWSGAALDGTLTAEQGAAGVRFDTQLSTPAKAPAQALRLQAKGLWLAAELQFDSLLLQSPQARIAGQLQLNTQSYAATAHLRADLPGAQATVDGSLAAAAGQGSTLWQVHDLQALARWLRALPVLGAQVWEQDLQGGLDVSAQWRGGWSNLGQDLQLVALVKSTHLDLPGWYPLRDLQWELRGTPRALALQFAGQAQAGTRQLALSAHAQLAHTADGQWRAQLDALQAGLTDAAQTKPWTLQLEQPLLLDWQQDTLQRVAGLAAGSLRLGGPLAGLAQIRWQAAQWSQPLVASRTAAAPARWSSRGELQGVPLAWLELLGQTRMANLGLRGDLVFGGQWDASADGQGLHVRASVQRTAGDLQLLASEQGSGLLAAGLRDAHVEVQLERELLQAHLVWASEAGGNADAQFSTRVQSLNGIPQWAADAALQGQLNAKLPRVGVWSLVAPVGWRMQGTVDAQASVSGSRANPVWQGTLEAHDMAIRSVVDGVDFSNGVLRLRVSGQHMEIAEFTLQGAGGATGGSLVASGSADWLPAAPDAPLANRLRMALDAQARGLRVTARPDQRFSVSGKLRARLDAARLVLRGALVADQALFVLPEDTAPTLGGDVVVKRPQALANKTQGGGAVPPAAARLAQSVLPDIRITLDPGSNFMLQGHGLNTRLAGMLTLQAEGPQATPRLLGELHTVNGTYQAYGQRLNIDEGTLRFSGAYDNPALAIRALRPNLQQVVGVQISGTAQLPVVRLYSDPDLPDADKLSWLVLGRASSNAGAETALLQQAALALLSGKGGGQMDALYKAVGLDEVSLGQTAVSNLDGSSSSEATVKLGKRLSRDFYVAYERSLAGTLGTFYVFYDLSRRLTLRGESGAQNAVDLIFTTRYD